MKKILSTLILNYFRFLALTAQKILVPRLSASPVPPEKLPHAWLLSISSNSRIVKHTTHANSESGIPSIFWDFTPFLTRLDWLHLIMLAPIKLLTNWQHFAYYVVEMGIDSSSSPKNMTYLLSILRPHVGVVLNASLTHAAGFDHLVKDTSARRTKKIIALIAKEKCSWSKLSPKGSRYHQLRSTGVQS